MCPWDKLEENVFKEKREAELKERIIKQDQFSSLLFLSAAIMSVLTRTVHNIFSTVLPGDVSLPHLNSEST